MFDDTIAAIATPLGEGGLAVIRLSGPKALVIAEKSFQPVGKISLKPTAASTHTIHYGKIVRQKKAHGRAGSPLPAIVPKTIDHDLPNKGPSHSDIARGPLSPPKRGEGQGEGINYSSHSAPATFADSQPKDRSKDSDAGTLPFSHPMGEGLPSDIEIIDEVLLSILRAPRTFTREDVVEITCHGGLLPAKLVLDTVLENGARLAEPGEFTRRAFLNGRIDLAQAEAVADLIHSRTELALVAANEQLAGKLSQRINQLRDDMMKTLAHIEAYIDFPEEDIPEETRGQLLGRLQSGVAFMEELLRTANEGQILRRGIRVAIIGRPNAGKSSLLNQLLGHDRAIVSPIPGTTRDTIEETANIRGIPVVFIDTAGLRDGGDEIEVEGIRRSRATLARAELVLHVFDISEPLTKADEMFLTEFAGKKRILVRNKMDLPEKLSSDVLTGRAGSPLPAVVPETIARDLPNKGSSHSDIARSSLAPPKRGEGQGEGLPSQPAIVDISCTTGQGMERLKDAIREMVWSGEIKTEMLQVMINSRHQDALNRARAATLQTIEAMRAEVSLDLVAVDLRIGVSAVGEIVGKTTTEDLLDSIFSQFCIGK